MKGVLASVAGGFAFLATMAAIPIFVAVGGATAAGLGSLGFLAWRAYRRRSRQA